mgnify:CR=1 FL=1
MRYVPARCPDCEVIFDAQRGRCEECYHCINGCCTCDPTEPVESLPEVGS